MARLGDELKIIRAIRKTIRQRERFEIAALTTAERLIKDRIHTRGQATDGSQIGKYSSSWRKQRVRKGRQVGYVDLSFEGDLIAGYGLGESSGKPVLGFFTDRERLKMAGQEQQRKKPIIDASSQELAEMDKAYVREFNFVLQKNI